MQWPFSKTMKIRCPDGTERIVYKNPDDAFPLVAKEFFTKVEATTRALEELKANVSLDLKRQMAGFFFLLDEVNQTVQLDFRALYVTYLTNPCERDSWLTQEICRVIERENKLRKLRLEITKIQSFLNQGASEQVIKQALEEGEVRVAKSDAGEAISGEFRKVEKNISTWIEGTQ